MKNKRKKRRFYVLSPDYEHILKELTFAEMAAHLGVGMNNVDGALARKGNLYDGKYPIAED